MIGIHIIPKTTINPVAILPVLMAALMSSLASVFNSCSTIFTIDIYKKLKPNASEKTLINTGKIATGFIVVLGIKKVKWLRQFLLH